MVYATACTGTQGIHAHTIAILIAYGQMFGFLILTVYAYNHYQSLASTSLKTLNNVPKKGK